MKNSNTKNVDCRHAIGYDASDLGNKCSHRYEMIYVLSGSGTLKIEGSSLPFEKETIYLLKPLTYYEICSDDSSVSERYHLSFSSSDLGDDFIDILKSLFSENNPCSIIRDFSVNEISRIFGSLDFAYKLTEEARYQYVLAMLIQILVLLSSSASKKSHISSSELASEIADFISENIENNKFLTLDEIAKTFFVSKFYLCRIFKSYSGISVHAYINRKRIMLAKQYIDSGMSAKSASESVGYQDYSAFYRAYVKIVGKSPKSEKGE